MKQETAEALYKDFLNMKESGELYGMVVREDEFGEKFVHVPWYYDIVFREGDVNLLDSIVEEVVCEVNSGTLYCLGYNV
jgi:hypothetical protein